MKTKKRGTFKSIPTQKSYLKERFKHFPVLLYFDAQKYFVAFKKDKLKNLS